MRMRWFSTLALGLTLVMVAGCGGDDDGPETTIDAGTPLGEGIVKSIESSVAPADGAADGQGELLLDVFHGDRAVNRKVKIDLAADGARDASIGKGEGNQAFGLAAGLYFATISYAEGGLATEMSGTIAGLKVNAGHTTKYTVVLEAPVGLLQLKYTRSDGPGRPSVTIDDQVTLAVYVAGGDRSTPLYVGKAGDFVPLPSGTYDVKATYDDGNTLPTVEWSEGLELAAGLAKTKRDIHLDLDASGVRIDAFNFSSPINAQTSIYFFNPGANVEHARAIKAGAAGESIAVEPGTYDLLVVYQPSGDNPDLEGRAKIEAFEVPERGGVREQVDVQLELSWIQIKVMARAEDLSERLEIQVKRAGADAVASSSVVEGVGGDHVIESGTYDIYLEFNPPEGDKTKQAFRGIDLPNGTRWRQSFTLSEAGSWVAAPADRPAQPLRSITWRPPGDDDDSGADDDDSAPDKATEEAPKGE